MSFDYNSLTKGAYTHAHIAAEYHDAFTGPLNWQRLRYRYVAACERRAVRRFLLPLQAKRILDLPCGTGKLAVVFAEGKYTVIAADVSPEMLLIASHSYAKAGCADATFVLSEAESASQQFHDHVIDVVVSLRLMHRVPPEIRLQILRQLSLVARYVIITYAIDSPFHRLRRQLRNLLFNAVQQDICTASLDKIRAELNGHFSILDFNWVAPFLSEEAIFLLESKALVRT